MKGLSLSQLQKASVRCPNGLRRLVIWLNKQPAGIAADMVYQVWDGKR